VPEVRAFRNLALVVSRCYESGSAIQTCPQLFYGLAQIDTVASQQTRSGVLNLLKLNSMHRYCILERRVLRCAVQRSNKPLLGRKSESMDILLKWFVAPRLVFVAVATFMPSDVLAQFDTEIELTIPDSDGFFGHPVSISDETAVVQGCDSSSCGMFVYGRNDGDANNWVEVKKLAATGNAVSVSGDVLIVGASADDHAGTFSGSALIFERNHEGRNNWGEVKKLTALNAEAFDSFGKSVSISGNTAIVGASLKSYAAFLSGLAYVFERNHGGENNWGEITKLAPSDLAASDTFGTAVSVSGDTAIVGKLAPDRSGAA